MAGMHVRLLSCEERVNAAVRDAEHRVLAEVEQRPHALVSGFAGRIDTCESTAMGNQQQIRAMCENLQRGGQDAVAAAGAAAASAGTRSTEGHNAPAFLPSGDD